MLLVHDEGERDRETETRKEGETERLLVHEEGEEGSRKERKERKGRLHSFLVPLLPWVVGENQLLLNVL